MKNNQKRLIRLTLAAMLIAMSFVIGYFCKNLLTFGVYYRITFENLPVILAGILLGPVYGAAVGAAGDVLSCIASTNPAVNPVITVGAALVGLLAGVVARYVVTSHSPLQYFAAAYTAHLFGQVIVKSIGKIIYFGMPWWGAFVGLAISLVVAGIEAGIICAIMRAKPVLRLERELIR